MRQTLLLIITLFLLVVIVQAKGLDGSEPTIVGIEYSKKDSLLIIDHTKLTDTLIKIISPSGALVFNKKTLHESGSSNKIKLSESGFYWIFYEHEKQKAFQRLYIK